MSDEDISPSDDTPFDDTPDDELVFFPPDDPDLTEAEKLVLLNTSTETFLIAPDDSSTAVVTTDSPYLATDAEATWDEPVFYKDDLGNIMIAGDPESNVPPLS